MIPRRALTTRRMMAITVTNGGTRHSLKEDEVFPIGQQEQEVGT